MNQQVKLDPITQEQAATLQNMVELYAHDFSEHVPLDLKANGRFDVSIGELWWCTEDHYPFFLRWREKLVGFALVRKGSRVTGAVDAMDVAEFFVIRGARGKKAGRSAAHMLFKAFPGPWEIRVRQANLPARRFWSGCVEAWTGERVSSTSFSAERVDWSLLCLDTSGGDAGRL